MGNQNLKRYVVTKRYAVTISEEEFEAYKEYLEREEALDNAPDDRCPIDEMTVVTSIVEDYHVGNNTDIVAEIDILLEPKPADHKFPWED